MQKTWKNFKLLIIWMRGILSLLTAMMYREGADLNYLKTEQVELDKNKTTYEADF